jgi:TolC family type I secretion outer membrane protein
MMINDSKQKTGLISNSFVYFLILFLSGSCSVRAESLPDLLPTLMKTDFEIKQFEAQLKSSEFAVDQKNAAWLPKVDLMMSEGWEKLYQAAPSERMRREYKLSLVQLLTDFGATSSAVGAARKRYAKKIIDLRAKKQATMFSGIQVYLEVHKNKEKLRYAKMSEANIKKQTGMEEARVQRGSGFSSDVLQAKSKLARAYARTARTNGDLAKSINNFKSLFQFVPRDINGFVQPSIPHRFLPVSLDEAIEISRGLNTGILKAQMDVEISQMDITAARAKHFPKLEFKGDLKHKHHDAGIMGTKQEYKAAIELNLPIFSGGKDQAGLSKAYSDLNAKKDKNLDIYRDIEQQVRNAWQDFTTDQINAGFLRNSANISEEFLVLARKERKLGRRSLIDVLSEENSYINALESAVTAETSVLVSAFKLLKVIGVINEGMIYNRRTITQ